MRNMSLKTRVALFTVTVFLSTVWLFAWHQADNLRAGVQKLLFEQQYARVQYIANNIDEALKVRVYALSTIASSITPEMLAKPEKIQAYLESLKSLDRTFSLGMYVISHDGKGIADFPVMEGRAKADYSKREYFQEVLTTGKPVIGKPVIGRFAKQPVLIIAVPVMDKDGRIAGVLAGANLVHGSDLFNEAQTKNLVQHDDIHIISPEYRIFIASNDPARTLKPIPEPGVNRMLDRYLDGFNGSDITVDSKGMEVLSSATHVAETDWIVYGSLPTSTAFAPVKGLQNNIYKDAAIISIIIALAVALFLRHQLTPLRQTSLMLHGMACGKIPHSQIPVEGAPEIRNLLECFNILQENLWKNEAERKLAEEERIILKEKMQQTQKLESLGVLAGGIAHDFYNLLMAIMGNADLALMRITPESPAVDNLRQIEQASAKAADLTKQMLAYSGKGKFVIEHIDISRLVEEMHQMIEVSISKKAMLRFNLTHPIPTIEADATQMRQIIMNLVTNASEAIEENNGIIAISTGCAECDREYLKSVWIDDHLEEGMYVTLEVSDTGCGMDKAILTKIFDPFYTTKFTGRGLGMAAVLGIVRGHKGTIKVHSEPGKGSSFKILLPASSNLSDSSDISDLPEKWKGSGTVLLVDDEETIRAIGSEMLRELGFKVTTAADGRLAVDVFKTRDDINLVILDLTMPNMDGEECFRELRLIRPDLKVIISSGYNQQEVTQRFTGKGLAGFIQKPYRLTTLAEVIKEAL